MAGSGLDPWRERRLLELVASGMTPDKAAGVAGMAVSTAYAVVRRSSGVPWREAVREAASARAAQAAARASGRDAAVPGLIASGLPPCKAARAAGVPAGVAYRLAEKTGGVRQMLPDAPGGGRYLSREERYEIARLRDQGLSVRQAAGRLRRSPSRVGRELGACLIFCVRGFT